MEKFSRLGEQSTASPWLCFFFFLLLLLCTKRLYYYYFGQNLVIDHCSHMMERVPAAAESPTTWRHSVIWFVSGCNLLRPTLKRKCVYLRITGDIFGSKAKKKTLCPFPIKKRLHLLPQFLTSDSYHSFYVTIKLRAHNLFLQHSLKFYGKPCDKWIL